MADGIVDTIRWEQTMGGGIISLRAGCNPLRPSFHPYMDVLAICVWGTADVAGVWIVDVSQQTCKMVFSKCNFSTFVTWSMEGESLVITEKGRIHCLDMRDDYQVRRVVDTDFALVHLYALRNLDAWLSTAIDKTGAESLWLHGGDLTPVRRLWPMQPEGVRGRLSAWDGVTQDPDNPEVAFVVLQYPGVRHPQSHLYAVDLRSGTASCVSGFVGKLDVRFPCSCMVTKKVAFYAHDFKSPSSGDVFVWDRCGSQTQKVMLQAMAGLRSGMTWSWDGRWLAVPDVRMGHIRLLQVQ